MNAPMSITMRDFNALLATVADNYSDTQPFEDAWAEAEIEVGDWGYHVILTEEGRTAALLAGLEDTRHGLEWAQPRRR